MYVLAILPKGTDWGPVAAWTSAGIAFFAFFVALLGWRTSRAQHRISKDQLTQAKATLEDRRLDERVKAILGENILLINNLTEQARTTLAEAKASGAQVEEIRTAVETINREAQAQGQEAREARAQLETQLNNSRAILRKLDEAASRADRDAEAISQVREEVTHGQQLEEAVLRILNDNGCLILPRNSEAYIADVDLLASFHKRGIDHLFVIEVRFLKNRAAWQTARRSIRALFHFLNTRGFYNEHGENPDSQLAHPLLLELDSQVVHPILVVNDELPNPSILFPGEDLEPVVDLGVR